MQQLAAHRVWQVQVQRVQPQPLQAQVLGHGAVEWAFAVRGVANDGVGDVLHVAAQLVAAACQQPLGRVGRYGGAVLSVLGGGFSLPGVKLTDIQLGATMGGGGFTLGQLKAASGSNTAVAKGQATLPASWAGIAQVPGRLDLTFQAPQLAELLPPGAAVTGQAEGKGTVVFANRVLAETTAEITAGGVQVQGIPVESAASRVRLEDGVLKLEEGNVRLNAQNTVAVTGQLALRGTRDFTVNWQADARDLATVPAAVRAGLPWRLACSPWTAGSRRWWRGRWRCSRLASSSCCRSSICRYVCHFIQVVQVVFFVEMLP